MVPRFAHAVLPTEPFKDSPGDLTVLVLALQTVLRLATAITVERHYGPNEELGLEVLHSPRSMASLLVWRTRRLQTRRRPTALRFTCMVRCWRCCGRIFRHVQRRCGGMRVTILFSRKASARDGHRLFGFWTYNVSLPSLLRPKRTVSRGSIRLHGALSSRSWRMRCNARPHCAGSYQ